MLFAMEVVVVSRATVVCAGDECVESSFLCVVQFLLLLLFGEAQYVLDTVFRTFGAVGERQVACFAQAVLVGGHTVGCGAYAVGDELLDRRCKDHHRVVNLLELVYAC